MKMNATLVTGMIGGMLAMSLPAISQGAEGAVGTPPKGAGRHPRPTPEQMAQHWMTAFDANKDGVLDPTELTKAVEATQAHHQAKGEGQGCTASNATCQAANGAVCKRPTPPPASEVAAEMITKFSSDGKGLTAAQVTAAIAAHQAKRDAHCSKGKQGGSATPAAAAGNETVPPASK